MYLRRTLTAFNRLLPEGGLLIFDKVDPRENQEFASCGFALQEAVFDPVSGNTFFVCRKSQTMVS